MCRKLIYLTSFIFVMFAGPLVTHAQVDDVISVPGEIVNILANGGFEDGVPDPWSTYGDVTTEVVQELADAVVPEAPIEGDSCLHIVVPTAGANYFDAGLQHAGHVFEAGKKYTLSAFLKSKQGTLDIRLKPGRAASPWEGYSVQVFTITEEWVEYSVTTPVIAEDVSPASITFHIAFAAGDFWIDGVRFYEGDYVSPVATITVEAGGDIAAANELAKPGDTIEIAEGTYSLTSQIEIKDGVTYRGAGAGLTIIDGNDTTRAFVAWGDRGATDGQVDVNGVSVPNATGPKGWVLEGLTIQNCVADTNNRFSYTSAAFNLKTDFATLDADASGGLNPDEADGEVGGIRLAGADGTEGTEDDDLHRFSHIDTDGSGEISEAELDAQILVQEDEFGDEDGDGGAITIGNEAVGTIANCDFLNNHTPIPGDGDDGGAVNIAGLSVVTINDCWFEGNYACSPNSVSEEDETGTADGDGGHIKVQGGSASAITPGTTLIANRCVFLNGNAEDDSGAIQSSAVGSIIRLDACWFEGNTAADDGTVLFIGNESSGELTVTNCVFANNISTADSDRMCQVRRNSKFINCTFVGNNQGDQDMIYNNANKADTDADGTDDEMADATQVVNCIFANNVVGDGDDVLGSRNNDFTIAATNCIFFGNTLQNGSAADNTQRPDVETGSVLTDPLLDANYVPGEGSEAIDGGVDPATVGVTLTTDYNGDARPQVAAYDIGAYESPPQPVDPGNEGLVVDQITSPSLEGNLLGDPATREVIVYLPPSYNQGGNFPVVYLLHGYTGNARTFASNAYTGFYWPAESDFPEGGIYGLLNDLIIAGELKEMIVVMPDASNMYGGSWYANSELMGNYEDYIVEDLVGYIDSNYRTIPSRDSRAIVGHSMGGYGAMKLAMKHPDVFGAVASHGGALYLEVLKALIPAVFEENPAGMTGPAPDKPMTSVCYSMSAAFSPNLANPPFFVDLPFEYPSPEIIDEVWDRFMEHDVLTMLGTYGTNVSSLRGIYMDAGAQDEFGSNFQTDAFHQALDAAGIGHEYEIYSGTHYDRLFEKLTISLKFLSDALGD